MMRIRPVFNKYDVIIVGGGPSGLLLSSLLASMDVRSCIVEKRVTPTSHPQAHFIGARSMEILQVHMKDVYAGIIEQAAPHRHWRDFSYGYSLLGRTFARVDHFTDTYTAKDFFQDTPANVIHFPQNKFETLLRCHVTSHPSITAHFGYTASNIALTDKHATVTITHDTLPSIVLQVPYLVGADGARSMVRQQLRIPLYGDAAIHTLINIHFKCKGLKEKLTDRPAMLYFIYNEKMIGVFVSHDLQQDEWVCQVPIFPPYTTIQDITPKKALELISFGIDPTVPALADIEILSIKSWTMNALVASSFHKQCAFLIGDAAHQMPPAGGFGMNTALHDAHNLAWKLARVIRGNRGSEELLRTYETERRRVAQRTVSLSLYNYQKTAKVATALGVSPAIADGVIACAHSLPFMTDDMKKKAVNTILSTGLSSLLMLRGNGLSTIDPRVGILQKYVKEGRTLPLIYPQNDIAYSYDASSEPVENPPAMGSHVYSGAAFVVGARIPHVWCRVNDTNHVVSTIVLADALQTYCLLVSDTAVDKWRDALVAEDCNDIACIVVKSLPEYESHEALQVLHHWPNYDSSNPRSPSLGCVRDRDSVKELFQRHSSIVDVTGRWQHLLSKAATRHSAVIVRPDGFVLYVGDDCNDIKGLALFDRL